MNKIISFLKESVKESDRYKHLIGGFFVGLLASRANLPSYYIKYQ